MADAGPPRPGPDPGAPRSSRLSGVALAAGLAGLAVLYGPLVVRDPVLARDDRSMLAPLQTLRSVAEYPAAVRAEKILDLQPLRDLSLLADLRLRSALGFGTFHLTNLLLFCLIAAVLFAVLRAIGTGPLVCAAVVLAFALHPVFIGSVGWISARKHLLSCLFAGLATLSLLRGRPWRSLLFYLLALLSHPIALGWPLWALVHQRRSSLRAPLVAAVAMVACAAANLAYYRGPYLAHSGGAPKLVSGGAAAAPLAAGRSLWNLLVPVALAVQYEPASFWNLAGLLAWPLLAWAAFRLDALEWLVFALLPIGVVTVQMTNVFVSDTYLLIPGFGLACLIAKGADRAPAAAAFVVPAVFLALGIPVARSWESDPALWHRAYAVDGSPGSAAKEAFYLADEGHLDAAWSALEVAARQPDQPQFPVALAHVTLLDKRLAPAERLRRLSAWPSADAWHRYALAVVYAQLGRFAEADREGRLALASASALQGDFSVVAAESVFFCQRAGSPDCAAWRTRLEQDPALDARSFGRRLAALQVR